MDLNLPIDPRNALLLQLIMMTMFVNPEWIYSALKAILNKIESLTAGIVIKKEKRSGGSQAEFFEIDMSKFD